MQRLVESWLRKKIIKYNKEDEKFLKCEIEVIEDQNYSKDLDTFAASLIKKYEKYLVFGEITIY